MSSRVSNQVRRPSTRKCSSRRVRCQRSTMPGLLVLDIFELQEELVGVAVWAAAELAAVVGEHGVDLGAVRFKGRQHIIVDQLDSGDRQLVGVEPGPGMAAVAVNGGLQIDLANALQDADEEG